MKKSIKYLSLIGGITGGVTCFILGQYFYAVLFLVMIPVLLKSRV